MVLKKTYLTEIRPLGIFLKLLGWLPSSRVETSLGLILQVKYFSKDFIYSTVMISLQLAGALRMLMHGVKVMPNIPSHLHIISYCMLTYTIIPHLLPLLVALQARNQTSFVKNWVNIQHEVETVGISGQNYSFGDSKRKIFIKIIIVFVLCVIASTIRITRLQRCTFEDFFLILGFFNEALLFFWYYYTTHVLKILSNRLLQEYQLLLEYNEAGNSGALLAKAVLNLRSPSLKLSILRKESGSSLSLSQGLLFIYNFTRLLFTAYLATTVMDFRILGMCGLVFVISVFVLYSICNVSHEAKKNWHGDLLKALACTKQLRICNATKDTMTGFLLRLIQTNPEISFSGYINAGRHLLSTLFSAFISYVVVVFQFKEYEKRHATFEEVMFIVDYFYSTT